ncbi:MAG: hypothetical protein L0H70_09435 [Xanthomonadales bacterium]|nr:hypothetical protein [Xanthomonadales bacterium]
MKHLPTILQRQAHGDCLELSFDLGPDCAWFDGHFPGQAILPGVVQIGWAAHFAAQMLACDEPPLVLDRVKFKHPLGPGAQLTLRLQRLGNKVNYDYWLATASDPISASSGTLDFSSTT